MQVADILVIAGAASIVLMFAAIPLVEKYLPDNLCEDHAKASNGSAPATTVEHASHPEHADNDNALAIRDAA